MFRGGRVALRLVLTMCAILALPAMAQQTVGLFVNDEAAFDGYNLMSPGGSSTTQLFSTDGLLVRTWTTAGLPA